MAILHHTLPHAAWTDPRTARLPGIQPLDPGDWLRVDEAFAGQMAERDRLIRDHADLVHALPDAARPAAAELYALVLDRLAGTPGYAVASKAATRPDGVTVPLDPAAPLLTLGRLVQEDLCLMEARGAEHALTGAILCFPASWTLAEKLGRPLVAIHAPVPEYDEGIARRVQRLFDAIRPGAPLWRMNVNVYDAPDLFHPRTEARARVPSGRGRYLRSERQCLLRLPVTGAVVFSIHTYVVPLEALSPADRASLPVR